LHQNDSHFAKVSPDDNLDYLLAYYTAHPAKYSLSALFLVLY
jgi:hypothetical protein